MNRTGGVSGRSRYAIGTTATMAYVAGPEESAREFKIPHQTEEQADAY